MRTIYLIRHGQPDCPPDVRMCLGRTDTPLGPLGRMQAALLGEELGKRGLTVIASPLRRCRETAAPLGAEPWIEPDFAEQDMGPWDGLDFDTIKARWPELYARRAEEPLLVPPGAETLAEVRARTAPALRRALAAHEGDLAIVAHATVIQALLVELGAAAPEESRRLRPPCGSYAELREDGKLRIERLAVLPSPPLSAGLADGLLRAAAPGERAEAHCRAVAAEAERIAEALPLPLDRELLRCAALLHDAARACPDHAALGAEWLRRLGYERAAELVAQHHDLETEELDEAAVLYLADKCVRETERVPLAERFAASLPRCRTGEARRAHERRRETALALREKVNGLCGREIID